MTIEQLKPGTRFGRQIDSIGVVQRHSAEFRQTFVVPLFGGRPRWIDWGTEVDALTHDEMAVSIAALNQ